MAQRMIKKTTVDRMRKLPIYYLLDLSTRMMTLVNFEDADFRTEQLGDSGDTDLITMCPIGQRGRGITAQVTVVYVLLLQSEELGWLENEGKEACTCHKHFSTRPVSAGRLPWQFPARASGVVT